MIKNGKKNKIKDLYSPFRCPKLPSEHSEGLIFAMVGWQFRTSLHRNGEYRSLIFFFFFLTLLYHLRDCKMVFDRF